MHIAVYVDSGYKACISNKKKRQEKFDFFCGLISYLYEISSLRLFWRRILSYSCKRVVSGVQVYIDRNPCYQQKANSTKLAGLLVNLCGETICLTYEFILL